ncbi:MAG: chromosome segregation ATPase [Planctomycetota bacterium]|jgi:chromosome segregation ATPase
MESVNEIKEALSARSRTATLDELRSEGRKRVRLIRAEHVAQMISEAVHAAIEHSGLLGQEEVDQLVEKSRQEFKNILREREQEVQKLRETDEQLEQKENELTEIKTRFSELSKSLAATRAELEQTGNDLEALRELPVAAQPEVAAPAQSAMPNDVMMSMMQELANLKATMAAQQAQPAVPQAPAPDFSAALEKLTGSLNDRLENLGRKMGVSSAVESDAPLDFGGMFGDDQKVELESNMDNIKVKTKTAGGIAANLARLKKLKGGG